MARLPLLCLVFATLAGCSAIPTARAPFAVVDDPSAVDLALVLPHPRVELSAAERAKGYAAAEVVESAELADDLGAWLRAAGLYRRVRTTTLAGDALVDEAWGHTDDLRLEVELARFQTTFEGHNALWIPNILNWAIGMVPAWFVATEEYSLSFDAQARLTASETGAVLHEATLPVRVAGTFDEFDRGWQLLGSLYPFNDEDNWRQIAGRLLPAARSRLGEALARELAAFQAQAGAERVQEQVSKTLALVVGVSSYPDPFSQPPLPPAARSAEQLAEILVTANGLRDRHVALLTGARATREELRAALKGLAARARPADQVVIYLACYGSRDASGQPVLLLADSATPAAGWTFSELAAALRAVEGRKLVVLDTSFGRDARGLSPEQWADHPWDAAPLTSIPGLSLLVASAPARPFRAPAGLDGGLFGHHLLTALSGQARTPAHDTLTLAELAQRVEQRTVADSAFFGSPQHPYVHLGSGGLELEAPPAGARTP